uniref:Methylisocitrate lyase n=1 Tax=Spongospora subterranea TaxID=70186 RepID=A0A0H5QUS4_9EUKA|eukprot:CRZ05665.1 hypothetical protein [Spongospora subterranea]
MTTSMGAIFRKLIAEHPPVQIIGCATAYTAMLAERAGAKALYVSGSGVATASHGIPDLGVTNLNDVVEDVRRLTSCTSVPILVDVDTGFGSAFGIARTVRELERAGAAAIHIEDQEANKRCGHRPNKQIVPIDEMCDRIKAAVDARRDPSFVIMARTDAFANEGLDAAIARSKAYAEAGADMLFPEALTSLEQYAKLTKSLPKLPVLANITEFGATPLFSKSELATVNVAMVLYPLSIHRAQAKAAEMVVKSILEHGHQKEVVELMQTRKELYEALNYQQYEDYIDSLASRSKA